MAVDGVATLLEREQELAGLRSALTEAQRGRGQLILIEAPAGLGKTSLLKATLRTAADAGFTCLRARASELERDFAFGCVRQLLDPVLAKCTSAERERLFDGAAALSKPLFAQSALPVPSHDSAFAMLHGLYWLLNNLSAVSPVAACIDDLHWADAESLRFLNYLAPRLDGVSLALLASIRSGEHAAADVYRLLAGPEPRVVRLQPLSAAATAALCERAFGAPVQDDFAAACRVATGGNPFFLDALLRELTHGKDAPRARDAASVPHIGPAAVAHAVRLRLAAAPPAAAALVRAAAVLGDGASVVEAAMLAEIPQPAAAHATDRLIALAILKPAEHIEFVHPIMRQAVISAIGAHERRLAHARAARILAECGASAERIAAQLIEAEPNGDAERVELLRRVASSALARGAPAAALSYLQRALEERPKHEQRAAVLLELGSAELRLAMPSAADHLAAAVEAIREPRALATAVRQLANAYSMAGDADRAVAALERAIVAIEHEDRELALILEAELAAKAQQARHAARAPAARRLARHRELTGATLGERLVLASIAFERARSSESAAAAAQHIERGLGDGSSIRGRDVDVVGPFYALVLGLLATDALDVAETAIERALADARSSASIPAIAFLLAHRAWLALRRGSIAQAEADARSALELLSGHGIRLGDRFALAALILALIERGAIEEADSVLRDSGLGDHVPDGLAAKNLLESRALLRLAQDKPQAALDDLLEFGRRDELWGCSNPLGSRWRSRACAALAALGDVEGARSMAEEDLERARRWGAATDIGVALRANALLDAGGASIDRLHEAVEVLRRSPARLELARALTDLGAALRRANRRAAARTALEEGLELANRCGAAALCARARVELRAAGGRSSDPTSSGVHSLTVSERRVAELAAKGHSNPEIAQTLFVTRKTVETHLGHVYSKLGISGRAQLKPVLANEQSATPS